MLRAAFERCVDLLDYRTDSISTLLAVAVEKGHPEIVKVWLDTPPCANDNTTREEGIGSILNLLVSYTSNDAAKRQLQGRQAQVLRLLVERYPALTEVPFSDDCDKNQRVGSVCPTLVTALLLKWHLEGVAAVLPLDARASQHLPPVALHVLRGEARTAAQSAQADPEVFHQHLPSLLATAPLESLQAALRAAPPDETALLTPKEGHSLYQHLSPLFVAVERRDADQPTWHFLWMLFDLFPSRLRELDTSLYSSYVIGMQAGEPNLDMLLTRLRDAGFGCEGFKNLARLGGSFEDSRQWYEQMSGCPMEVPRAQ